jgi:hypothetical protein
MNSNESRTLWLSIGFALLGAFIIYSYTQEQRAQITKDFGAQSRVVVAGYRLKNIGQVLTQY